MIKSTNFVATIKKIEDLIQRRKFARATELWTELANSGASALLSLEMMRLARSIREGRHGL